VISVVSRLESAKLVFRLMIVVCASFNCFWIWSAWDFAVWLSKETVVNCSECALFVIFSKRFCSSVTWLRKSLASA
jgi:hypothetical protein